MCFYCYIIVHEVGTAPLYVCLHVIITQYPHASTVCYVKAYYCVHSLRWHRHLTAIITAILYINIVLSVIYAIQCATGLISH